MLCFSIKREFATPYYIKYGEKLKLNNYVLIILLMDANFVPESCRDLYMRMSDHEKEAYLAGCIHFDEAKPGLLMKLDGIVYPQTDQWFLPNEYMLHSPGVSFLGVTRDPNGVHDEIGEPSNVHLVFHRMNTGEYGVYYTTKFDRSAGTGIVEFYTCEE